MESAHKKMSIASYRLVDQEAQRQNKNRVTCTWMKKPLCELTQITKGILE